MDLATNPAPIEDVSLSRAERRRADKGQPVRKAQAVTSAVWSAVHSPIAHLGNKQFRKLLKKTSSGQVLGFYRDAKAISSEAEAARASGNIEHSENQKRLAEQIEIAEAELKSRGVEIPTE